MGTTSALFLAFLTALIWVLVTDPLSLVYGDVWTIRLLLILPILGAVATAGTVVFTVQSWHKGHWGLGGRLRYMLVTFGAVGCCWLLYYWNLLGIPP